MNHLIILKNKQNVNLILNEIYIFKLKKQLLFINIT